MRTHTFTNLMLDVYEILGLKETTLNMRDQREHLNFSQHQRFFSGKNLINAYEKIIDTIDSQRILSEKTRLSIFYKYEQLFNGLISTPILSTSNKNIIMKKYGEILIPAIVSYEIIITRQCNKEKNLICFYDHIHLFLLERYPLINKNDPSSMLSNVREYLRNYIKELNLPSNIDLSPIHSCINKIRLESKPKNISILQAVKACTSSDNKKKQSNDKLEKIKMAYISLNSLLNFQKKTNLLDSLYINYKTNVNRIFLHNSLLSELNEYLVINEYNGNNLNKTINTIIKYANLPMSSLINDTDYQIIKEIRNIIFDQKKQKKYTKKDLLALKNSLKINLLEMIPYLKFLDIILSLQENELKKAYFLVNEIKESELPPGYLTTSIAIIKISLEIKLKKDKIRNGSLISFNNIILTNPIVYGEALVFSPNINNTHLPANDNFENPIIKSPNNSTIIRSIMLYNKMIDRIYQDDNFDFFQPKAQSVYGLLDNLEEALKKINIVLHNANKKLTKEELAYIIINDNILTKHEINGNLIGILEGANLYNCMGCLDYLCKHLRSYGEDLSNIISFVSISVEGIEKLELVRGALLIAKEKLAEKDHLKKDK
ncbi:hypothetical protein JNG78_06425 [Proteus mirabilis]|uniref:hypothetical protein n=1 Tax=Proteus mirabilis TaxID=584 RepID=UPI001FAC08C6|nr:hypothetical protein [Proteus mirabilis]MCI9727381.1 hypothetical protein [Proteus mirabilis]MCI9731113.1 hypothetical protein [Proteus mirabilis]MCI9734893.1 hypothetical protein [Proteus mirabilis]MCI9755684.1 hypothetical protein [Proteus mirabilis]MCI9759442.1 hypothetical protein [Proteus mirabilis]